MNRLPKTISGTICGLMLLCGFGAEVYPSEPCLIEVLPDAMDVYAVFTNMTLDFKMKEGKELKNIPKEYLNDEGTALVKNYEIRLYPKKAKGSQKLKVPLEVIAQEGQKYRLRENTDISYTLPAAISGYKVILPKGTPLTRKAGTDPQKYALAEDVTAEITPPHNYQATLKVNAQLLVERIPGTSSTGTTLEFDQKRAPVGEYITITVKKNAFDFSQSQINVCLRKKGKDESNKKPFIPSNEVELKEVQIGKAILKVRIPDIEENGIHLSKPVDLLVVARLPNGEMAEAVSQEFVVSSHTLGIVSWILAFAIPWLVAGMITVRNDPNKWFSLNPILFVSGKYGRASLSLAQILIWTILVFSASFYVLVVSGKLLDLTNQVLMLLGIVGGSSVIAKITASARDEKGREIVEAQTMNPKWMDLFQTEGRPDLYKVQLALFTTLAAFFVTGKIYGTLEFPELPAGLLTLIGISNGVYIGAKTTSKSVFERLADKSNELRKAKEELKRRQADADEARKHQQRTEEEKTAAITTRDSTEDKLDKEQDAGQKVKLNELLIQQKAAAREVERRAEEAAQKTKDADDAKNETQGRVKKLKDEFKKLKDEALSQG